jgi:hypothetical protein
MSIATLVTPPEALDSPEVLVRFLLALLCSITPKENLFDLVAYLTCRVWAKTLQLKLYYS